MHEADWQACFRTPVEVEAHVVKGFLEQYGVPCLIRHNRVSTHPLTFCALGTVEILVPEDWTKVAQGLIEGRNQPRRMFRSRRAVLRSLEGRMG